MRLAAALGSNIPAPMPRAKSGKRAKRKAEAERAQTVSFNGAVVGSTPPAVPVTKVETGVEIEIAPAVAVRLRDDADAVVVERLGCEQPDPLAAGRRRDVLRHGGRGARRGRRQASRCRSRSPSF